MGSSYSIYLSDNTRKLVELLCEKRRGSFTKVVVEAINKELEAEGLLGSDDSTRAAEIIVQLRDAGLKPGELMAMVLEAQESGIDVGEVMVEEIRKAALKTA